MNSREQHETQAEASDPMHTDPECADSNATLRQGADHPGEDFDVKLRFIRCHDEFGDYVAFRNA